MRFRLCQSVRFLGYTCYTCNGFTGRVVQRKFSVTASLSIMHMVGERGRGFPLNLSRFLSNLLQQGIIGCLSDYHDYMDNVGTPQC